MSGNILVSHVSHLTLDACRASIKSLVLDLSKTF